MFFVPTIHQVPYICISFGPHSHLLESHVHPYFTDEETKAWND